MKFEPKGKETLDQEREIRLNPFKEGEYDAECIFAEDTTSKTSGKEMIHVQWKIFGPSSTRLVDDYITAATEDKLYQLAHAINKGILYSNGSLSAEDIQNQACRVNLGIEKGKAKPDGTGERYPDRNKIRDYLVPGQTRAPAQRAAPKNEPVGGTVDPDLSDDEIPF